MSFKRIKERREARKEIENLFSSTSHVLVIHYSCESFYDTNNGATPRITSIAVRNLASGQTNSFSIHKTAEIANCLPDKIARKYDEFEKQMLDEFFNFVNLYQTYKWLHWNMRDINYGFQAIEHRYKILKGKPICIRDESKTDLSRLLIRIYGRDYINHPRLENLMKKNHISSKDFFIGKEEADAFKKGDYVGLHRSTLRKVDVLANIASRACDGTLKTLSSWWDIHGGYIEGTSEFINEHPLGIVIMAVVSILGIVFSLYEYLKR